MPDSLRVVALISGGKDSFFSLLHCLQNGHRIIALANLYPPAQPSRTTHQASTEVDWSSHNHEDMNSFMYQTVGHQIIPVYAEALGLPLYRREIKGVALQTGRYYDTSELGRATGDETEDLTRLLREVLHKHPEVNSVSSGAILSTYQRTRVESVATRLGLTPLAYLWQYPVLPPSTERPDSLTGLLDDMAAAGCDAKVIKIATGGMKESLLWANVADTRTRSRLVSGMAPFFPDNEYLLRAAVLGEGGEYETLAIDGPRPLWTKRLVISESDIVTGTGDEGVHYARIGEAFLEDKQNDNPTETRRALVRTPKLYDPQFEAVLKQISTPSKNSVGKTISNPDRSATQTATLSLHPSPASVISSHVVFSNITASDTGSDAAAQMSTIIRQVRAELKSIDPAISPSKPVFALLLLSSTSDFAAVNTIYASLIAQGEPNPPARVTVAVDLPPGVKVSLSLVLCRVSRNDLCGLHVQGRSYWAPANIGPYSQAICEPVAGLEGGNIHDAGAVEIVHMAGQIPLIPHTMEIVQGPFSEQAVLGLQHLWRVGQERGVDLWPWGISFVSSGHDVEARAQIASDIWLQAHTAGVDGSGEGDSSEDEVRDVWYARHYRTSANQPQVVSGAHLHILPNNSVISSADLAHSKVPPFLAAEVVSLPRGAAIEWWSVGVGKISSRRERATLESRECLWGHVIVLSVTTSSEGPSTTNKVMLISIFITDGHAFSAAMASSSIGAVTGLSDESQARDLVPTHTTAFISPWKDSESTVDLLNHLLQSATIVPCRNLWGSLHMTDLNEGQVRSLDAAIFMRIDRSPPAHESDSKAP